jgi:competence protein ComEC
LRALGGSFEAERGRWALWAPVFLGFGIAAYFALAREPDFWIAPLILLGALAMLVFGRRRGTLVVGTLMAATVALGFVAAQYATNRVAAPVLAISYGPASVTGRVIGVEAFARKPRVLLDRLTLRGLSAAQTPARVRIRLRDADLPAMGARIEVFARLSPPSGPAAPGAFDFRRHAWFTQIGAYGYALGTTRVLAATPGTGKTGLWISRARHQIATRVRAAVPGPSGAVAAALITGDRSAIPVAVMTSMRDSGLAHLLAISGLHMGLVAAILFVGLRAMLTCGEILALRYPIKKWAAGGALCGALGYMILTGATVPTQRAFLMTGLVLIAVMLDRTAISLRLVAWAAAVILLIAPQSLLGASFQMSFAAVVALIAVYEQGWRPLGGWFTGATGRRAGFYIGGVALTTLIAGAATGLVAMYHFGRIAHFGLAVNLIAVPITALWIMPWAVMSMALMPFGLEAFGLTPMVWGIDIMLGTAREVGGWPGAVGLVPAMPAAGLAALALGGLWLCIWRLRWRYLGLVGIAAGLLSVPLTPAPDILVSGDGRLMAVRLADGALALSSARRAKRVARVWLNRAGLREGLDLRAAGHEGYVGCDGLACIYRVRGQVVALVTDARALPEDCRRADIVISAVPVRGRCAAARLVVDRFDLWREGAHAIWLNADGIRVETVSSVAGNRPWSPPRPPRKRRQKKLSNPASSQSAAPGF